MFSLYLFGKGKTAAGFLAYHHRSLQCLLIAQPQGQDSVQDSSTQLVPAEGGLTRGYNKRLQEQVDVEDGQVSVDSNSQENSFWSFEDAKCRSSLFPSEQLAKNRG